jgi:hypothetical protein
VTIGALGIIVIASFASLFRPPCPLAAQPPPPQTAEDSTWGSLVNLKLEHAASGDVFSATATNGFHRIIRYADIAQPGRYRLSIEAQYKGTDTLQIEIQNEDGRLHADIRANLKAQKMIQPDGDLASYGMDQLSENRLLLWMEMDLPAGRYGYNVTIVSAYGADKFADSSGTCRVGLANPSITPVGDSRSR